MSPIEVEQLSGAPPRLEWCPICACPFLPFMRGQVQSWWRRLFNRPYCCLICWSCKRIVGYEHPDGRWRLRPCHWLTH